MISTKHTLCSASFALGSCLGCSPTPRSHEAPSRPANASPPQLVVLRPAAGDVWIEGNTYTIRWRATGITRLNVGLALGGKDKGHAALNLPASTDSLRWHVPIGFVSGFGIDRSDNARVRVEDTHDPQRFADSPSFTIVARR
jgi:hypothetical protein